MGKKYTTDEIHIGGHELDAAMMVNLNTVVSNHTSYLTSLPSHTHDDRYVQEGGTNFNGVYPMVVRVSDRSIYSHANITFTGSTSQLQVGGSVKSPIFYDSNNTGYFLNPASTSNLNTVAIAGITTLSGRLNLDLTTDYDSTVVTGLTQAPMQIADVNIGSTDAYLPLAHMSARYTSGYRTHMNIGLKKTASAWGDSTTGMYVALGGNDSYPTRNWLFSYGGYIRSGVDGVYATDSFRAPIFYDSNNTGYYLNPASTSNLNTLNAATINRNPVVTLSGDVTGNATMTNLGSINITTTVANDSHEHSYIKAGGDGPSTEDLNSVADSVAVGRLSYRGYNSSSTNKPPASDNANGVITVGQHGGGYNAQVAFSSNGNMYWRDNPGSSNGSWRTIWDSGNDGSGSGLDADLLDGQQPSQAGGGNRILQYASNGYLYNNNWIHPANGTGLFYDAGVHFHETGNYMYSNTSLQAANDMRAPIFYDRDNTGYYLNPAGSSRLGYAHFDGYSDSSGNARTSTGVSLGRYTSEYAHIDIASSHGSGGWIDFSDTTSEDYGGRIRYYNSSEYMSFYSGGSNEEFRINSSYTTALGSSRAPTFYDSDNTGYYLNPASTSKLNAVRTESLGVNTGSSQTNKNGLSLYGATSGGEPTYGMMFTGTAGSGTHGAVTSDWATYFTMNNSNNRGWIFRRVGSGNSASISAAGAATFDSYVRSDKFYDTNNTNSWLDIRDTSGNYHLKAVEGGMYFDAPIFYFRDHSDSNQRFTIDAGIGTATSSLRAPVFYDSNDTNYYVNPTANSIYNTSQINYLGIGTAANTSGGYRLNMGGSFDMNNHSIDYLNQLHFQDNVRFYDDNNDNYLNFKYGNTGGGGIKIRNGASEIKGYIYGSTNEFGLLDNDGSWAVKTQTGTNPLELMCNGNTEFQVYDSYTISPGSSRAPIFYDSDNTIYHVNPTGESVLDVVNTTLVNNNKSVGSPNSVTRVIAPDEGVASWDGTNTGAIKIKLPWRANNIMWSMTVEIYNYSTSTTEEYTLGNYSYSNGGYNSSSTYKGAASSTPKDVRFGNDGTNDCVWIGSTTQNWYYPVVTIKDVSGGFRSATVSNMKSGYNISIVTSFDTVQTIIAPALKSGTIRSSVDMRTPILFDSNNTTFYVDPNSTSNLNNLTVNGTLTASLPYSSLTGAPAIPMPAITSNGSTPSLNSGISASEIRSLIGAGTSSSPNVSTNLTAQHFVDGVNINSSDGTNAEINPATTALAGVVTAANQSFSGNKTFAGNVIAPKFIDSVDNNFYIRPSDISYLEDLDLSGSLDVVGSTYTTGLIQSSNSMRAPIFYDSNNTSYYVNPHATSNMVSIQTTSGNSFISKLSGTKSWLKHITTGALVFAPSASNNGSDWSWANEIRFSSNGTITSNGHITRSDERLKTKITDLPCNNIDVAWKSYELKSDEGEKRVGVIAQELEETHPEFVITDSEGFKSVKYIDLLIAKIAELEARLQKLEN